MGDTANIMEQTGRDCVALNHNAKSSGGVTRAVLYVRVSAKEQTSENQERELRAWAGRLGFNIVRVYADTASGVRSDRAGLAAVLAGAHRREFDVLLIWSLDRLSREGIGPMAGARNHLPANRALEFRFEVTA